MNKILFIFLVISFGFACKKDSPVPKKAFEDITYTDIESFESKFSNDWIYLLNAESGSIDLYEGAIILFLTDKGNLGKFKIAEINHQNKLIFDFATYNGNGGVLLSKSGTSVDPSFTFDLDAGIQSELSKDFWWNADFPGMRIHPEGTAKFYIYSKN